MAHFAKLDENNKVIEVHVVHNDELTGNPVKLYAWNEATVSWVLLPPPAVATPIVEVGA